MKICFFIQWLKTGGAERNIVNLSNHFVNNGNCVDIVLLGNTIEFDLNPKINVVTISEFSGHESVFTKFRLLQERRRKFLDYYFKRKPDIIVCLLNSVLIYLPRGIRVPVVSSERSNPFKEISWFVRKISFNLYNKCDGLIFQTNSVMRRFPRRLQRKGIVIKNPVVSQEIIEPIDFSKRNHHIIAVGRLHCSKGFFELIDAFQMVLKKHNDYYLDIYGDGELKKKLDYYISKNNLRGKVALKGNQLNVFRNNLDSALLYKTN